ncbi:MAG: DUF4430 domain-containing protein [Oscillospiraceae bacterium]|nr:DUF4430 domain-containing protein [Oscillospiraceae bacterium]
MWWKKNKYKVIIPAIIIAVLAAAFWYGGGAPGLQGWSAKNSTHTAQTQEETAPAASVERTETPEGADEAPNQPGQSAEYSAQPGNAPLHGKGEDTPKDETPLSAGDIPEQTPGADQASQSPQDGGIESRPGGVGGGMTAGEKEAAAAEIAGDLSTEVEQGDVEYSRQNGMVIDPATGKDRYLTDPVPEGKPAPVEPQDVTISDEAHYCTISISCTSILENIGWLDPEKVELVPEDGWILEPLGTVFYEGESVFNVLHRVCKQNGIHMEFTNTPMYNSAYIEGIHNLYEFDCGELSGWMYKVNDWFPNYGCSRYALKDGDVVEWVYTCNLGIDVGGYYSVGS